MSHRSTVLIVDDEPENLDLLERALSEEFEVCRATSGEHALAILGELPEVAVILTDQRMPGLRGTELLRQARASWPASVRIIVTGYATPDDLVEAINSSNVHRVLTKPWDVEILVSAVRRAARLYDAGGGELLDEVTALPNRILLLRELEREIARCVRTARPFALLAVRVPELRSYAAVAGVACAEELLAGLGSSLLRQVRAMDVAGRYGADVFLAVLSEAPDGQPAVARVQQALEALPLYAEARSKVPRLELEVKQVAYPRDGGTVDDLLRALRMEQR